MPIYTHQWTLQNIYITRYPLSTSSLYALDDLLVDCGCSVVEPSASSNFMASSGRRLLRLPEAFPPPPGPGPRPPTVSRGQGDRDHIIYIYIYLLTVTITTTYNERFTYKLSYGVVNGPGRFVSTDFCASLNSSCFGRLSCLEPPAKRRCFNTSRVLTACGFEAGIGATLHGTRRP